MKKNNNVQGIYLMICGVILYTLSDVFVKKLTSIFPVSEMVFLRSAFRGIPLFIIICFKDKRLFFSENYDQHLIRTFWGISAIMFFVTSLKYGAMTSAYVIGYSGALFTMLFSSLFLKEKIGFERAISVFLGMLGIYLALAPGISMNNAYVLAPLLGVMCAAMNKIMIKRLTKTDHILTIVFYVNFSTIIVSLIGVFSWEPITLKELPYLFYMGILAVLSQYFIALAIKKADISALAHCDYSSFVIVVLVDIFCWENIPGTKVIMGALLIIIGNLFVIYGEKGVFRRKQNSESNKS